MIDFRCRNCNRLLGKYKECKQLEIKCPRCGYNNQADWTDHNLVKDGGVVRKIEEKRR
jgi:phage FluMu protein Com